MKRLLISIFCVLFASGAFSADVKVPTYKGISMKGFNNLEKARAFEKYAQLPGTVIKGPKHNFSVRRIVYQGHVRMVAFDTKGNSLNQVGAAIVQQTNCNIKNGTIVEKIRVGWTRQGFAFHCL